VQYHSPGFKTSQPLSTSDISSPSTKRSRGGVEAASVLVNVTGCRGGILKESVRTGAAALDLLGGGNVGAGAVESDSSDSRGKDLTVDKAAGF
jgi:hypothetical protein